MPSRAYTSFLRHVRSGRYIYQLCVNALSGLYLISTEHIVTAIDEYDTPCQCPLGLIPHFYLKITTKQDPVGQIVSMPSRAYTSFLRSG